MIGSIAISSRKLDGIYTIYIEHIGLLAVTVEMLFIGWVLGDEFIIVSNNPALADKIQQIIADTLRHMHDNGFEKTGVSYGSAAYARSHQPG